MLKGIRIVLVLLLASALTACATVSPEEYKRMTPRQRAELQAQQQEAQMLVAAALGHAVGVAAAAGNRRSVRPRYTGHRSPSYRGNNCGVQYWTPNPQSPIC